MTFKELKITSRNAVSLLSYDKLKACIWASPLSKAKHIQRERVLRKTRFAKKELRIFVVSENEKTLGGLELWPIEISEKTKLKKGYIVACIVVDEENRGKGIGSFLIRNVVAALKKEKKAHFAVLYSEIGESYYENFGFRKTSFFCLEFDLKFPKSKSRSQLSIAKWLKTLSKSNAIRLWKKNRTKKSITTRLVPDIDHFDWHLKRSQFYESKLKRRKNQIFGLEWPQGYLIWIADYKYNRLRILEVRGIENLTTENCRDIEKAVLIHCQKLNLNGVTIWEGPKKQTLKIFSSEYFISNCTNEDQPMVLSVLGKHINEETLIERMSWV